MQSSFSYSDCYQQYIQNNCPTINEDMLHCISLILEKTAWDTPQSAIDWNNLGVIALIEAEHCSDQMREVYLEMAVEAFSNEAENHPLCTAHLALVHSILGELEKASQVAFSAFVNTFKPTYNSAKKIPPGLIYLPSARKYLAINQNDQLNHILQTQDGYVQSLLLSSEVLCRSELCFYSPMGLRLLQLAAQLLPHATSINLRLGISSFINNQWEGLFYLHRAQEATPDDAAVLQALHIIYRDLGQPEVASYWLKISSDLYEKNSTSPKWYWTQVTVDSPLTYVTFEDSLLMAVEPSFCSIVTSVLLAEGDWFEKEMEFWRNWIHPGMTIIDVGANVGIYTFSAARRVGAEGCVLAVEPFSGCVRCLKETCRINHYSWVKVCAGAASDHNGTAHLSLHDASELNEIVSLNAEAKIPGDYEEITCFTLDSLCDLHNLHRVDFLKIDAEGHEISVLKGSEKVLAQFFPIILYENIASNQGSNREVAEFLKSKEYQLFHYQPYIQRLVSVDSIEDFQEQLNLIAVPNRKTFELNL
jgi:FkbM family methyltransferase